MALVRLDKIMTGEVDSFNITESDACSTDEETEVTKTATAP